MADLPHAYLRVQGVTAAHPVTPFAARSGHWTVGTACVACGIDIEDGDLTTLVALGPGSDREERARARVGRWYTAVAIVLHYACVTGVDEPGSATDTT